MKLVKITKNTLDEWKKMRQVLYGSLDDAYHDEEMSNTLIHPDWHCSFIVSDKGEIMGFVELSSRNIVDGCLTSPVAYLEGLYLKEPYRNKGYGKRIIKMILSWCKENGFKELGTDAELDNTKAQDFYESLGFEEVDRVVSYRVEI